MNARRSITGKDSIDLRTLATQESVDSKNPFQFPNATCKNI